MIQVFPSECIRQQKHSSTKENTGQPKTMKLGQMWTEIQNQLLLGKYDLLQSASTVTRQQGFHCRHGASGAKE